MLFLHLTTGNGRYCIKERLRLQRAEKRTETDQLLQSRRFSEK